MLLYHGDWNQAEIAMANFIVANGLEVGMWVNFKMVYQMLGHYLS